MTSVYDASGGGDRRRAPSGGAKANTSAGPADRFLHVCYCCSAEVRAEVCSQFVDQLAFRHVMTVVGRGRSQFGTPWISMHDVTGVALDLVEDSTLSAGQSRLAHLRVACSDLARSVSWYEGLGFEVLAGARVDGAAFLGMADEARGRSVRLRLRAEPFEVILTEWETPSGHGHHPENANHAGLFRAAIRVEHPGRRTRP